MKLYDVSGLTAKYVRPATNLTQWAAAQHPDALCNASLYDMKTRVPVGTIIESGQLVHNDGNGYGFGIADGKIVFGKPWDRAWDFYLTGYTTCVLDGQYVAPSFADRYVFDCALARIGMAKLRDGRVCVVTDDGVTLKQFAEHAIAQGADILVNLDGGGSRHLVYGGKTVYASGRVPYNAIAFYQKAEDGGSPSPAPAGAPSPAGGGKKEATNSKMKYIDVSEHQGIIDWERVKGNVDGVILRAGAGQRLDSRWERNARECNRLGIPIGAYWFSYAKDVSGAQAEAGRLLEAVKPYRMELPLAYDFEYDSVENAAKAGVAITKALASSFVRAFCGEIEKAGYWALNYANPDYLNRYFDAATARYGLWLAQWQSGPNLAKPPRTCAIWQWNSTGHIPGIDTVVDIDEAYTDFKTVIAKAGLNQLGKTYDDGAGGEIIEHTQATPQAGDALAWAKAGGIVTGETSTDKAIAQALWRYHAVYGGQSNG